MKTVKELFIFTSILLLLGFLGGAMASFDNYQAKLATNERLINTKAENAIEQKFSEKEANMQLYVMSADDVDTGERVHFYFRSDDNPFWRAHEIMEIEKINFENLVIKESDLLEEEK